MFLEKSNSVNYCGKIEFSKNSKFLNLNFYNNELRFNTLSFKLAEKH